MTEKKKQNPWLEHVKKFRKDNKDLAFTEVLKKAKQTYTPIKKKK